MVFLIGLLNYVEILTGAKVSFEGQEFQRSLGRGGATVGFTVVT